MQISVLMALLHHFLRLPVKYLILNNMKYVDKIAVEFSTSTNYHRTNEQMETKSMQSTVQTYRF
jgi:hypothetical protein